MCLATITKRKNLPKEVTVLKAMQRFRGGKYESFMMPSSRMVKGQWYPCGDTKEILTNTSQTRYLAGWHAWEKLDDELVRNAIFWECVIVKVKLRKLICKGKQGERVVFVGREMKIVKEVEQL